MNWKRTLLCFFCAAALILPMSLFPVQAAKEQYFFLAINEQLYPLSSSTMPISVGYTVYVPYTVFDPNVTGVDMGLNVARSAGDNTVTVFTRQKMLLYDLHAGTAVGNDDVSYTRAVSRGGIIYLPVSSLCNFFAPDGPTYTYRSTEYGPIIRLTTPASSMTMDEFVDPALLLLPDRIRAYERTLEPSASPSPSPVYSPTASPSPSPSPVVPSPSPSPSPSEEEIPDRTGVPLALSLSGVGGDDLSACLDALDARGVSALFFFRPQEMLQNSALIRRIALSGHSVGFLVPGGDEEETARALEEGSRLLELIAHTDTRFLLAEEEPPERFAQEGWIVWNGRTLLGQAADPEALLQAADEAGEKVVLTLSGEGAAQALAFLLPRFSQRGYSLHPAAEAQAW